MNAAFEASADYAHSLDQMDTLFPFRERFLFPQHGEQDVRYFCGNSLGLQPKSTAYLMQKELDDWAAYGVEGHTQARNPWLYYHHLFSESLGRIVGAEKDEVVAANTLTVNLHLLMLSFYRPTKERYKIIMEAGAFPSDQYAMETQAKMWGFNPEDSVIEVAPREGEFTLRTEDILAEIEKAGRELALVMFGGVNYYTGQLFDMAAIVAAAHGVGAYAGFDLAHAVGNVPLQLHDWGVDFACWCSYKYLNSGPGGVGGIFVHRRHGDNPEIFRLAGWWGNEEETRFKMKKGFHPQRGAASWQMSNAPVFNMVAHRASLDIYDKAGMAALREKSLKLTGFLQFLLDDLKSLPFSVITPCDESQRGCQISMLFHERGREMFDALSDAGIVADWREPDVIRVAPVPLYNTYEDVFRLYEVMKGME